MNARLKKVKDGTGAMHRNEVVWFDVLDGNADTTRKESGEIYWPFALVWNCAASTDDNYDVIHLPSGYWFISGRIGIPRRKAIALVRKLRTKGDWSFTKPKGKKWETVKVWGPLFRKLNAKVREAA
jgi:hypothetical protein